MHRSPIRARWQAWQRRQRRRATLADPRAANAKQEQKTKGEPDNRGVEVKETVPSSVFDKLDHTGGDAGVDAGPPRP